LILYITAPLISAKSIVRWSRRGFLWSLLHLSFWLFSVIRIFRLKSVWSSNNMRSSQIDWFIFATSINFITNCVITSRNLLFSILRSSQSIFSLFNRNWFLLYYWLVRSNLWRDQLNFLSLYFNQASLAFRVGLLPRGHWMLFS